MKLGQFHIFLVFSLLSFCNSFSQTTQNGKSADDYILELKKDFLKNIQGTWIVKIRDTFKELHETSELSHNEVLIISEKELQFYSQKNDSEKLELIKKEIITTKGNTWGKDYLNLIFADNNIWKVTLKSNDVLHFINTGELLENGTESIIVCGNPEKTYRRIK
ncbi:MULTISPECIES: hypothetical protein [Flavobacterium]|uniref:hypothetical protein n=1 Tax=Flavobacterium TaxID=237 RepID=UPI001FCB0240|nr:MULTISPECIES: hypothetical protein [Flavobacterium]UOK42208.1 hypothetical protein LZF87_12925 [Flavobacterium enshiense]